MQPDAWTFGPSFPNERAEILLAPRTFEEISDRIVVEAKTLCCHLQLCDDSAGFSRVVYCIEVNPDAFDLFYNAPCGYRGCYFRSPYRGVEANAQLLQALTPKLTVSIDGQADSDERNLIHESLTSPSAKLWLAENGLGLCPECEGQWGNPSDDAPDILNGRWDVTATDAARRGRKAPQLTKIRVFGAFLDASHNEFVPARKRRRAVELYNWGWS